MLVTVSNLGVILFEIFLAIRLLNRKSTAINAYIALVLILLGSSLINLLYSLEFLTSPKIMLLNLVWTSTFSSAAILALSLRYLSDEHWFKISWGIPLLIDASLSLWVINSMDQNLLGENGLFEKPLPFDVWVWIVAHETIVIFILSISMIVISRNFLVKGYWKTPAFFIGIAVSLPILISITGLELILRNSGFQLSIFVISALIIGVSLSVLRNKQLFLSRNYVVDNMSDGWVLIDTEKKIIDINSSAEHILNLPHNSLYHKDATTTLAHLPVISTALKNNQEIEARASVPYRGKLTYIHLRLSHIKNSEELLSGYLLLLRDDTERRKLDIARQEARDEMFSLLHSIAGAASHSENFNEFINAVMFQMNYSFQCTSAIVFLNEKQISKKRLLLIAQIGIENKHLKEISFLDHDIDFITHIILSRETLLAGETRPRNMPEKLATTLKGDMVAVPIFDEDIFAGLLIMTKENDFFRKDEVVRIEIAVQQIGSFIHNDRRRHAASTIAERQRLIRDLHDSVTQRLYSLVMLTEAARLELNTGIGINSKDFIEQFGFSARQALKEMRLFLYKMQPVDLRDGFANALMRRLDAVEGRAGLEVDLNIDQNIAMPPEDELHLYMIAQEALNNVIKHASAGKIRVHYQKVSSFISLGVQDNGSGFLPEEIRPSGLGLRSIKERVELIGGKMQLVSSPGKGTKITVLVPEKEIQ